MADKTIRARAHKESLEGVINSIIGQLRFYFEDSGIGGNYEKHLNHWFDEISRDRSISAKSIIVSFVERTKDDTDELKIARERILTSINTALYFCYKANIAQDSKNHDKAWFFAAEASKWQGMASGSEHAYYVRRSSVKNLAASGGRGRSDIYSPLRQFVLDEVNKKSYPSKRNAALSLKDAVLSMASDLKIPMSEQQAEKTITGWLKDIPFASTRGRELANLLR